MKTKLLAIASLLLFVSMTVFAEDKEGPKLEFEKDRHDYGTVYVDSLPETKLDVTFTNTGDEPLVLSNVRACCGTRVRDWPKEPIMPGEEGTIKVEFRLAPRPHRISRTVSVHYNNDDSPRERYRIVGEVVEREQ